MRTFIRGIPKAELHLHLEGSLEPAFMFDAARRNGIDLPYASVAEVEAAYDFGELQDFLDIYYQGMGVLQTERDFYDLTWAYLERVHADNVIHAEVFFDPQGHTSRGIPFATAADGILRALDDGQEHLGISAGLIMCFLRHLSEDDAFETLEAAEPYIDRLLGVGLDSSELGHPPAKFERVFAACRDRGLRLVAHAGEEGPPDYVRDSLDLLKIERVDHGNRALEDPALVERIVRDGLAFTVCPLSNLKLCGVADMREHPLKRMLELGLKPTVNSDDPAYFGGYVGANFEAVQDALDLSRADIVTLARNSFEASFLPADAKAEALAKVDAFVAAHE